MERLVIEPGPVYTLQLLEGFPRLVDTDFGQANVVEVLHNGERLEWVISKGASLQLGRLLPAGKWLDHMVDVIKTQDGKYSKISVTQSSATPQIPPPAAPEAPAPAATAALPPIERTLAGEQRQVISYETPYSLEITRGMKGAYSWVIKVRSVSIPELLDDANAASAQANMLIGTLAALEERGPPDGNKGY